MQKVITFLEKHVQWLALGFGGLILLWMIFSYVLSDPVTATVDGKTVSAGEVDQATVDGPIAVLKREIAKTDVPEIPIKEYVQSFVAAIQGANDQIAQLSGNQIGSRPVGQPVGLDGTVVVDGAEAAKPVEALPKPPLAKAGPSNSGRSSVTYQDPTWEPKRVNEPPKMIEADIDWWSGSFTISAEALNKAFIAAIDEEKINNAGLDPVAFMQTAILDVELVRQELLPGGKLGKEEIIQPLKNSLRPPFPGKNATEFEKATYLDWATQNPLEVISPVFYEVLTGDFWTEPSEENEQLAAMNREERRAARKLEKEQQLQQQQMRRQQQQMARGARGGANLMGDEFDGMMMEGDMEVMPPAIPQRAGVTPRGPSAVRPGRGGVAAPVNPGLPIGPGTFDVAAIADIHIIVHDDTVQAGKTYRYKIRYKILNPVYKSTAAKPELTQDFAIASQDSGWTDPVTIRAKVEAFLAEASGDKAQFDVFQWKNGAMVKQRVTAAAGDAIVGTGSSVVDVRGSGRKAYVLVMNDLGHVTRRDADSDINSDRYQDLIDEVEFANPQVGINR